jgi:tetratricopeptide (TPR) repeat protein
VLPFIDLLANPWRPLAYLLCFLVGLALLERGEKHLPEATELLFKAGNYLSEQGRYAAAEPLLAQAVAHAEAQHGPAHPALIPLLVRLGAIRQKQGNYASAQTALLRALALAEQHLGFHSCQETASMVYSREG